ncbi:MAG: response regulator [Candidatus Portnoybacteria bacterium CG06_land_8_20_14_3_00_39_12]|uniref:Response regulator n=3 Tax=Candidatus Portnoyibacteriota TaxID=1817913 RepID=A0A2M8KG83_9BACT|nr:MAG: response regulator [Parcubacteria group bacterium CG1_02_40_25]PIU75022.1 MAG: response regulator [Candidatus Portnoybacteria bacterium CG06_land_8_20_14_3_00_39_12]PIZ71297.1 MAG: response regulator [Candidatus Portnoybacteria bacterium CG_4_10_14_0_2_um_filter_39_11]PJE58931.1 MAG: response regulator [Candidatus Portnoybacteria bacterium CG10_big_fil_rev_8_21_14_0_10_40_22]
MADQNQVASEIASSAPLILVVEDDKFLRDLLAYKIEERGYRMEVAVDGEEGIKQIKTLKPDLVLLDLILPGIDGFGVLGQVHDDPQISQIPVIILSNLGQQEEIEKGLSLGAEDYMIKAHFTPQEVVDRIKKILGR